MTTNAGRLLAGLLFLAAASADARPVDVFDHAAVMESLCSVHPRLRGRWLSERGLELPGWNSLFLVASEDSGGLRLVGKFGRGPAVEVTGQDSLVYVSLGSEVAIINVADPRNPVVLSEPQAMGIVSQAHVRDSLLFVGCCTGQTGIEVWNVADPRDPVLLSRTRAGLSDFCIQDTLLYVCVALNHASDSFKVFSIADPTNLRLLGACRDSGDAIAVAGGAAMLANRWGLYILDVSDPRNPHRANSYPGWPIRVEARGSICCAAFANPNQPDWLGFDVLDVSDPAAPRRLGGLDNTGGYDIFMDDTLVFLSGYSNGGHDFKILSIADSTRPRLVGACNAPGEGWGVWADGGRRLALVADRPRGLAVIDITATNAPTYDTSFLKAGYAQDVAVQGSLACVASDDAGLLLYDVGTPGRPVYLGQLDSTTVVGTRAVAVRDSFAYMGFFPSLGDLHTVDITNATRPRSAGGVNLFNRPEDIVLRDSFVFIAEQNRLQVVNVARPREPRLVGSCVIQGTGVDILLRDTLAFVSSLPSPIINVSNPAAPVVIGTLPLCAYGIIVIDTFALAPDGGDSLWILSVSNLSAPRRLGCIPLTGIPQYTNDITLVGSRAYTAGSYVHELDVTNPAQPRDLSMWRPPYVARRIEAVGPYLYLACWDAGVCIVETTQTAISEERPGGEVGRAMRVWPSVARGEVRLRAAGAVRGWRVIDVTGRVVMAGQTETGQNELRIDLLHQPPGVYCIETVIADGTQRSKVIRAE